MKILIIMGGFLPGQKFGGPPVSVDNFCTLMNEEECFIVTRDHEGGEKKPYENILHDCWNDRGNCKVLYLQDNKYKKKSFDIIINQMHPDIIYLQGLFQSCVFPCLQLAKKYRIKVLLAPRGELCEGAFNVKKYKKVSYIGIILALGLVKNVHFQSTSDEETGAIGKWLCADEGHIHYLSNVPSIPKKKYPRIEKISGKGKFIFLSRIHPKKNLKSAIMYFRHVSSEAVLDIYGPIEDKKYWEECCEEIKKLPENIKVEYKGIVSHEYVHEVFSQYDAFLFPTISENYGHVIAESLIVGTPVIISDQTPWRELTVTKAGWDLNLNTPNLFEDAINTIIFADNSEMTIMSDAAKKFISNRFNLRMIKQMYSKVLSTILYNGE